MSSRWPKILMYHAVTRFTEDPNRVCISPELFAAHLQYLKRRGLRGASMRELRQARQQGRSRGLIGLTFDDGYDSFLQEALPLLERHGFTATVFVVSDKIGKMNEWEHRYEPRHPMRLLNQGGLREVSERGMEVGSHTVSHARLPGLDPQILEHEVTTCGQTLSEVLGETVDGFCYPYGDVDRAAINAVRNAGYAYACAWKSHFEWGDYDLPRIPMDEQDHLFRFKTKLRIYPQYAKILRGRK